LATDEILERIRKLLRLSEDAGATEAEAAAALERANALLIRHNLTLDAIAVGVSATANAVVEAEVRTGWSGSWRGSLLGALARHNLCAAIVRRQGRVDSIVVVGRAVNVEATHTMYDWVAEQLEHLAQLEWRAYNAEQRQAVSTHMGEPWCPNCEDWTSTYAHRGRLVCEDCDQRALLERPLIHGFTWKTAFFRGALARIATRLLEQRRTQAESAPITALVLRTDQENAEYLQHHYGELRKGRARRAGYYARAWQRGQERAGDVSLTPQKRLTDDG
jgi:hypothetical protein